MEVEAYRKRGFLRWRPVSEFGSYRRIDNSHYSERQDVALRSYRLHWFRSNDQKACCGDTFRPFCEAYSSFPTTTPTKMDAAFEIPMNFESNLSLNRIFVHCFDSSVRV